MVLVASVMIGCFACSDWLLGGQLQQWWPWSKWFQWSAVSQALASGIPEPLAAGFSFEQNWLIYGGAVVALLYLFCLGVGTLFVRVAFKHSRTMRIS